MPETLAIIAALLLLSVGTFTDFRRREVPDWVSYSGIAFGLGFRLISSLVTGSWLPVLTGALGFGVLLIVSLAMYYTGQWGGGDSKVIMALGAIIGIEPTLSQIPFLAIFLVNLVLIGSIYGLLYSLVLAILHWREFSVSFKKELQRRRLVKWLAYIFAIILIILSFFIRDSLLKLMLLMLAAVFLAIFYMWLFIKAIEFSVMIKYIPVEKLTEGDWIAEDVKIAAKYICGPKDLGIEKKQIALLLKYKKAGKISQIKIKEGIPFVPGFFLAFIATLLFGNWLRLLLLG